MFSEPSVDFSSSDEFVLNNPPFSSNYVLMTVSGKYLNMRDESYRAVTRSILV